MSYHKLSVSLLGEEDRVPQEEQQGVGVVVGSRKVSSQRMTEQRSGGYVGMNGEAGDRVPSEQKVNMCRGCELERVRVNEHM